MARWKKIAIVVLAVVASAAAYGFYLYNKPPADIRKSKAAAHLTAAELAKAFNDNETAANEKYTDKVLVVTGKVNHAEVNEKGYVSVILDTGDPLSAVACSFYDEESKKAANIVPGVELSIKGVCTGKLMDVVLNKCSFVDNHNH